MEVLQLHEPIVKVIDYFSCKVFKVREFDKAADRGFT